MSQYNPYQSIPQPQVHNYGFSTTLPEFLQGVPTTTPSRVPFIEQSYIENIMRLNKGKVATVYTNFDNSQWGSKIFKGVVEAAGKDHIILSDPQSGMRYLILTIFLDFITFDEEISYDYPFASQPNVLGTAAPIFNNPNR